MKRKLSETSAPAADGINGATARIRAIDLLKVLALAGVVSCHSAMQVDVIMGWAFPWWIRLFELAVVISIPGFFFASGYVLLGRKAHSDYRYVARKSLALIVASFVMGFIVLGLHYISGDVPGFHIVDAAKEIGTSLLVGGTLDELWFVAALILVYLLYPLINRIYIYNRRLFVAFTLLCLILMAFCSSAYLLGNTGMPWYEPSVPKNLRLWNWVGYFCLGGMMRAYPAMRCVGRWWVVIPAAAATLVLNHIGLSNTGKTIFEYVYGTPAAVLLVTSVAALLLRMDLSGREFNFLDSAGMLFFPSFLLCDCVLVILSKYNIWPHPGIFMLMNTLIALTSGIAGAWVLTHTPVLKRLLRL